MKISIVTPVYNGAKFIQETFNSILIQKGDFELEHIIVDGNSSDKTPQLIADYVPKFRQQFGYSPTVIREDDSSMYEALAKGFAKATGNLHCYLNADDIFLKGSLAIVAKIFSENDKIQWLSGKPLSIHADGSKRYSKLPSYYYNSLIQQGFHGIQLPFVQQESCFWKAQLWEGFDWERFSSFKYAGDFYMWYCFSHKSILHMTQINLCAARIHDDRLSSNTSGYKDEMVQIRDTRKFFSYFLAAWVFFTTYFLSDEMKMKLNNKIIFSREL
jgi:glycosyltransferase involved in cell wall biosynthesis